MSDTVLTPLGIVILGLLTERPMHPYEMYQLASRRRGDPLVKVKPGSLYHTVGRLEQQKLLEALGTGRDGNRPERTTYKITEFGRKVLEHQLRDKLAVPVREYPRLPLALAEMHNLSAETVCEMLRNRIACLDVSIVDFEQNSRQAQAVEKPRIFTVGIDYVHAMTVAERDWLRALVADIEIGDLPWLSQELIDRFANSAGSSTPTKD